MEYRGIAIVAGRRTSFLDHLVPLCHLMDIPLLCTDRWLYTLAEHFYPKTELVLATRENFQEILSGYQTFYTVEPSRLHPYALQFGEFLYQGEGKTVNGFHGNPDKFRQSYWIERYADEDVLLVYGQHMVDYLKEKRVWPRLKKTVRISNLRLQFYTTHKPFFDRIAKPHLFVKNCYKTVLWAPTWSFSNSEHGSPFFHLYPYVLDAIGCDFQVIVKLHPYLFHLFPEKIAQIKERYAGHDRILFLDEIPIIYPLLNAVDIYLGDYSSVGYDFLARNRPLFFLENTKGGLQRAGVCIDPHSYGRLYQVLDEGDRYFRQRQEIYQYAFGQLRSWSALKQEILK